MARRRQAEYVYVLALVLIIIASGFWIYYTATSSLSEIAVGAPYKAIQELQHVVDVTTTILVNKRDDIVVTLGDTPQTSDVQVVLNEDQASVNRVGDTEVVLDNKSAGRESPAVEVVPNGVLIRTANMDRKRTFKDSAPKYPPGAEDLPPFRMNASATHSTANTFEVKGTSAELYGDHGNVGQRPEPAWKVIQQEVFDRTANDDSPMRFIAQMNPGEHLPGKVVEQYGNLAVVEATFKEIAGNSGQAPKSYNLLALDKPLVVQIDTVDQTIGSRLARAQYNVSGSTGICIIDTGIDYTLPQFAYNYVGGFDFVNNDSDPIDDAGHGTSMADAIVTIAPGSQLYAAKALNSAGAGTTIDAIKAIDWCMQQNVTIISMSLGGGKYDSWCDADLLAQKANEAAARGFLVVSAAGNVAKGSMTTPACGSLATSVGATTNRENESVWAGSGLTNVTDLLAPGARVTLTTLGGAKEMQTGTSISAAVTSGGAALVAESTGLQGQELQDRLRSTGALFTVNGTQYPRIQVYDAINNTQNGMNLTQQGYQNPVTQEYTSAQTGFCFDDQTACTYDTDCNGDACSSQTACVFQGCLNYGSGLKCQYSSTSCSGTCASWCDSETISCQSAPTGTTTGACSGGTSCSGQNVHSNTCDGSGGCGWTSDICDGDCDSYCSSGACQNTASGADPYNICSDGVYCSGNDVINGNVCGSSWSCGVVSETCGTGYHCSGGACVADQVCGNGITEGTETCDGQDCCNGSCNGYLGGATMCRSAGADPTCDPAEYCTGSSANCPANGYAPLGTSCGSGEYCTGQSAYYDECNGAGACQSHFSTTCSGNCDSYCSSGSCYNTPANTDPLGLCSSGVACSGQNVVDSNVCGTGTTCGYTTTTCSGNCDSYCSSGACQNTAQGADPYNICSAGYTCSGQAIIDGSVCGASTACGNTVTTCSGDCDSVCATGLGTCQDTAANADPYNICSAGVACSGQNVVDSNVCGTGTTCGYTTTTCSGNCDSYCSSGACQNTAQGADPYNICSAGYTCSGQTIVDGSVCGASTACGNNGATCAGTCDSACNTGSGTCYDTAAGVDPLGLCADSTCTTGNCGTGAACEYTASGQEDGCPVCQQCNGAGACANIGSYVADGTGSNLCSGATGCENADCVCDGSGNCDINNGYNCGADGQCVSNICRNDYFDGAATSYRCLADESSCVDNGGTVRASGATVGDSTCYGSASGGSVWLATSGRFIVKSSGGTVLGVVDKYGSFGVRGTAAYSQGAFDSGWQVKDSGGNVKASINSANGNLKAASTLSARGVPSCTGFQIKNSGGTLVACITSAGAIQLRGDLAYSLSTLS